MGDLDRHEGGSDVDTEARRGFLGRGLGLVSLLSPSVQGVVATVAAGIAGCKGDEPKKPKPRRPELVPEVKEIKLGNVRFVLEKYPTNFSSAERARLFANMKRAYDKLSEYFGVDLMAFESAMTLPIHIDPKMGAEGQVVFQDTTYIDREGLPHQRNIVYQSFNLKSIDEDNLAHEMTHLFLQRCSFYSMAFTEGHGYAMQEVLYGKRWGNELPIAAAYVDGVSDILNVGLDFNRVDVEPFKGGLKDHMLEMVAYGKWRRVWSDFVKEHPDFLKNFYKRVAELRNGGKTYFPKADLVSVASEVLDDFHDWYRSGKGRSLQDLGEDGERVVFRGIKVPDQSMLLIFNFRTGKRKRVSEGIIPPKTYPLVSLGEIRIFDPSNSKTSILTGMLPTSQAGKIEFSQNVLNTQGLRIWAGGREVPLN